VSLTQTASAIVVHKPENHAYFIQPDKASNWISDIDLGPMDTTGRGVHTLEAVDPGPDPKLLVQTDVDVKEGEAPKGQALFAVNRQGTCFGPAPSGQGWRPLPKVQPFLTLSNPSDDHIFVGLLHQIGTESLLSVYTKEAKPKKLTEKEVFEAADRFLAPEFVAPLRQRFLDFGIDDLREVPNSSETEREKRRVTREIKTAEEWKRLLPDSYAEVLAYQKRDLRVRLEGELTASLDNPIDPETHRNLDAYSLWLESIRGKAETVFDIISNGRIARRFQIPGSFPGPLRTAAYKGRFDWRAGQSVATVVLPLDPTPTVSAIRQPWSFFRVETSTRR
jgi:hypothetical protein